MARATSVSLAKFTAAVQAAVKAAVQKHPRFRMDPPSEVAVAYLIRGIPVPDEILNRVTVAETQDFADEIAARVAGSPAGRAFALGPRAGGKGAVLSLGGRVILGFPPPPEVLTFSK
jgi:hypothetical protein